MTISASDSLVHIPSESLIRPFKEPPSKIYLLYGDAMIFPLSLSIAAYVMHHGTSIAVVDGCNQFDVHLLTRYARERHIDPDVFLNRIFISRGFTCYQMEAAVTNKLMPFLRTINSRAAMIFGLLDTFYDEQAPLREAQQILQRVLAALRTMKAAGISVLLACKEWNVLPRERNQLFAMLKAGVDGVYRLTIGDENKPQLFLEQHRRDEASRYITDEGTQYGTHYTNVYEHYRQRTGKLVEVPTRTAHGRPGIV